MPIQEVSAALDISHKHLIDLFKQKVGLRPKQFARIVRFNHMLHSIDFSKSMSWSEVALQNEYYDQAHFIKEFYEFASLTPGEYRGYLSEYYPAEDQQDVAVKFRALRLLFYNTHTGKRAKMCRHILARLSILEVTQFTRELRAFWRAQPAKTTSTLPQVRKSYIHCRRVNVSDNSKQASWSDLCSGASSGWEANPLILRLFPGAV